MIYFCLALCSSIPVADTCAMLGVVQRGRALSLLLAFGILLGSLDFYGGFGLCHTLLFLYTVLYGLLAMWYGDTAESQDFIWNPARFLAFPFLLIQLVSLIF